MNAFPNLKMERPVDFQDPRDGSGYFYAAEQPGRVVRFKNNSETDKTELILDLKDKIFFDGGESGLLGLAFDPEFKKNGYFYVNYTAPNPLHTRISRFRVKPDGSVDPASEHFIIRFAQPYSNHNGGQIAFGPDGYFYIGTGDGGAGGDPHGNGQNPRVVLGKILRLDVRQSTPEKPYAIPPDNPFANAPGKGAPEVYAWGLRNPWRFSFDRKGRLWVGDVGQNEYEEIDIVEKGKNYGWNIMEGNHCFKPKENCPREGLEKPVFDFPRRLGGCVIGGFVYQGKAVPELRGQYLFTDFISRIVFITRENPDGTWETRELLQAPGQITSFGQDGNKEIYALDILGRVFKFARR